MPGTEKMSIIPTPELVAMMNEAVGTGNYTSTGEVIDEALCEWHTRHIARQQAGEEIGRLWDEGIQGGPGRFSDVEELIQEAERRYQAAKTREK